MQGAFLGANNRVCLNSGALTAFGGCIHRILASLRSPLHPFGSPTETKPLVRLQALLPRRSRRCRWYAGGVLYDRVFCRRKQGAFHSPPALLRAALQKTSRRVGASIPPRQGFSYSSLTPLLAGGFPRSKQPARPVLPFAPLAVCLPKPICIPCGGGSILRAEADKFPPATQNPRHRPFSAAGVFLPLAGRIA